MTIKTKGEVHFIPSDFLRYYFWLGVTSLHSLRLIYLPFHLFTPYCRGHMVILTSDQPTFVKFVTRSLLLTCPWQLSLNCLLRSLHAVSPVDCAIISACMPCFLYLLCWIIVHRRFCALRVRLNWSAWYNQPFPYRTVVWPNWSSHF